MLKRISNFTIIKLIIKGDLLLPAILLISYLIFLLIAKQTLPNPQELISQFGSIYAKYGYEVIFIAALLEALILINLFIPGQLAMAMGAIFARTGQTELTTVIAVAVMGSMCGYLLDYAMGYFGFGDFVEKLGYGKLLNAAKSRVERFGNRGLILGFVNSNIGGFLSFTAGIVGVGWIKFIFISFFSTLMWAILWGITLYTFGDIILDILQNYSTLVILLFVGLYALSYFWKRDKDKVI